MMATSKRLFGANPDERRSEEAQLSGGVPAGAPSPQQPVPLPTPAVSVRGLTKTFVRSSGELVPAIDDLDLDVNSGEIVALLGPSGCGKTTLLRCIAGLERPTEGQVDIGGRTVFSSRDHVFVPPERRNISMVFQSYALWPHKSVLGNVEYPLRVRRVGRKDSRRRALAVLETVGISELAAQYPSQLSGGQQQRVALARSLVVEPAVILFDEPLSNVDARVRDTLRIEILAMHRSIRFAALYVTHDQEEAMRMGHRVAVLRSGKFAQFDSPRDVYRNPTSRYVANFVGNVNEFAATLVESDGALAVDVGGARLPVESSQVAPELRTGDDVCVVVRPEAIAMVDAHLAAKGGALNGTIVAMMFLGAYCEYVVDVGQRHILVRCAESATMSEGDSIGLTIETDALRVVKR